MDICGRIVFFSAADDFIDVFVGDLLLTLIPLLMRSQMVVNVMLMAHTFLS